MVVGVALEATTAAEARDAIVREIEIRLTLEQQAHIRTSGMRAKAEKAGVIKELTQLRDFLRDVTVISRGEHQIAEQNRRLIAALTAIATNVSATAEDLRGIAQAALPPPRNAFTLLTKRSDRG